MEKKLRKLPERKKVSELDNHVVIPLKNIQGYATCVGKPTQETIDALNAMAELAFKKLKKPKK